jgi:DNA gyrase subunit A
MVVTVSHLGYVKRVPLSTYRAQRRGGKGRAGMQTRDEDFVTRLFVASTHTPILFFSSKGRVYKEKVWRLPLAAPQARGKALINILPLEQGEGITTIMPLPEDESTWSSSDVMFATTRGTVRRNKLSDFSDVRRSGIIAMKLGEGEGIVDVRICTDRDDVLLTTARGQCIRFPVTDVRVFSGRTSMGVRGIAMAKADKIISLTILHHYEASPAERAAYLKQSGAIRRAATGEEAEVDEPTVEAEEAETTAVSLSPERYAEMGGAEQFILTVTELGYGKRSSSFEFRLSSRGGKGIRATDVKKLDEIGHLVAAFPVEPADQIMLVSDGGQLIRVPVDGIRMTSRASKGVRVFNTGAAERVASVERISEEGETNGEGDGMTGK